MRAPRYYFTGDGCRRDKDGYYWLIGARGAWTLEPWKLKTLTPWKLLLSARIPWHTLHVLLVASAGLQTAGSDLFVTALGLSLRLSLFKAAVWGLRQGAWTT